jgi:Sporulation factor SpoIIGA.
LREIVYGDILFVINFSMDFLTLYVTAAILHRKVNTFSLILSAGLGAMYAVISLFVTGNEWLTLIINIGVSALMCYIVFGIDIKALLLFYTVSFMTGGGITALYNLFNSYRNTQKIYINGNIASVTSGIPLSRFIVLAVVSLILSVICGRIFNRKSKQKSAVITAKYGDTVITFTALSDSGNLLKEPVSGMPVIVTSYNVLKPLLPEKLFPVFENHGSDELYNVDFRLVKRVKLIPMTAVGHSGVLMGFVPDFIVVDGVNVEACIAADMSERDFGGYESVMPAVLMD